MPCILWDAAFPPDITGELWGSTATTFIFLLNSFNLLPIPAIVPPVPTEATKTSKFSTSFNISTAVVS